MGDPRVQVTVLGDAEVREMFKDAGSLVREKVRRAMADIGEMVRAKAASLAPTLQHPRQGRRPGALAKSIRARLTETNSKIDLTVRPSSFYAGFVEYGVVSHGNAHNKAFGGKRGKVRRVRELRAAGKYRVAPHPYMEPAADAIRGRVEGILSDAIDSAISEVK